MNDILSYTGWLIGVAGAVAVLTSKVKNDNLNDLKDRVELLEKEREESRSQHLDNQKAIANLEGQLKTYKEIPLKQIANSLTELSASNTQILGVLQATSIIAAKDRDTLLNPIQHVDTQEVENQIVKNKE